MVVPEQVLLEQAMNWFGGICKDCRYWVRGRCRNDYTSRIKYSYVYECSDYERRDMDDILRQVFG